MALYKVSVINSEKNIEIHELELKNPGENQVLIKVETCAICTLEQRLYRGAINRYPFAWGHEAAGRVISTGQKVISVQKGDLAAVRLLTNCGECYYCRTGHENQCIDSFNASTHPGLNGPGGLAEYMLVDSRAVYKLRDDLNPHYAALTEPLACCVHSIGNASIELGDDAAVIGAGTMGLFHIALAKMRGARVIVCELDPSRLKIAANMGADILINPKEVNLIDAVMDITGGRGVNAVFCTASIPSLAEEAVNMAGKLGRVVLFSSFHPSNPIPLDINSLHYSEKIITGSVNPGINDFNTAARLLNLDLIKPEKLVSGSYPLEKIYDAFEHAILPGTYRVFLDF